MTFLRITGKTLPDGNFATVYPFHVTTEGLEDRVICITDTDLRTAFNLIPICAHRANVIVVAAIVLNTHMHTFILARNYEDAWQFIVEYKMSLSKCITNSYGKGKHINIYKNVNSRQMDVQMVVNPQKRLSLEELMKVIDSKSRDKYKKDAAELTYEQKIPLVKKVFYSTKSSVPQLARCFGIRKDRLAEILNLEWEAE